MTEENFDLDSLPVTTDNPSLSVVSDEERAHRREIAQSRTVGGMEERWRDQDKQALVEAIAANAPPVITVGTCKICQSPHRLWIERQLIRGYSYTSIEEKIPNGSVDCPRRSIANHYKKHMDLESAVVRALMEEEADKLAQNYEEGIKGAFSNKAALGIMIRMGFSDILDRITTVEPKDIVKMMEMYDKMDASSSTKMVEEAKAAIAIFMEAINNVFSDHLEREEADMLSQAIVSEVKRLREQNELEAQIENHMRQIPSAKSINSNR